MKSPEFGKMPNQERKITTPEEAMAMTLQRRREYGLGDNVDLAPEKLNEIETQIAELLNTLYKYNFDELNPETQDEWYLVELEAEAGKDRELAKAVLEQFINALKNK